MDRGQAHTLEAIVSALLLLASVAFALQMTAVTPLSASTSSQHIENQQRAVGTGVLAAADSADAIKPTLLYWNESSGEFHNASSVGHYSNGPPDTRFGRMLERSFDAESISYNVYLRFQTENGNQVTKRLIHQGVPSDNAVRSTRTVTLVDDDRLYDHEERRTWTRLNESTFYADDVGDGVFNVVSVEVIAWRI